MSKNGTLSALCPAGIQPLVLFPEDKRVERGSDWEHDYGERDGHGEDEAHLDRLHHEWGGEGSQNVALHSLWESDITEEPYWNVDAWAQVDSSFDHFHHPVQGGVWKTD